MEGTAFSIEEASFDASLLPEGSRTPGTEAFHRAVTDYFQTSYASMGGQLSVVFAAGRIEVAWEPAPPEAPAMASIVPLLQQRRFAEARPLLETLLQLQPEHPEVLYNLGVLASEEGQLEEARQLLRRAVVANAGDAHAQANAQVALGLAALRQGDKAEARQALEAAIELEPQNVFALRSLGSLLVIAGALTAGAGRFRQALAVAPDDLITTYNLAQALLALDPDEHRVEADRLLLRVIEAQPYSELGEKAKELRGTIAARDLRADQPEGLRQDAVSYCLQALQLFEGMDQQRFMAVLSEVAAVGQGGLQINEPGSSRTLKTLPGSWSDLALACLIHVGMKRLTPDEDSGLGIEAEYEEAARLHVR
ncbi:tetratricopeptide repeat protein [Synechococcus sp. HJ21-Hayes]|uniref:tetratricopeptide repeat protein n=1 Tax=Synechococcus sp. HJ21-Hayes TaxID=2823736 RepID=UPI0020CD1363|nr:tetratricopeptide repeat protein [Synechococcus sp. HJ21-Hayes]MCP9852825.1 tetratricopeptide repeat protein [Synechococcus sp. HJ21-Hayes]